MAELLMTLARPGTDLAARSRASQPPRLSKREATPSSERVPPARVVQPRLLVGPADDPFEREAERTAQSVAFGEPVTDRASVDRGPLAGRLMRFVQRAVAKAEPPTKKDDDEKRARKSPLGPAGPEVAPAGIEADVRAMSSAGSPLPESVRGALEPRFGFDFSDVRIHVGPDAAGAAHGLGARAFTVGDHIFFGAGQYQPATPAGQHLIAHELTHTIQQKPAAARAARLMPAPRVAQRLFDDAMAAIAEKIRNWITRDFPPWDLITLIVGWDPIRNVAVKGATRDWIRAAMKLAPDGEALFERLDKEGKVDAIAAWWDAEVAKLDLSYAKLVELVKKGWDLLSASDVLDPAGAWNNKLKPLFVPVVRRVWDFIKAVGAKVFQVVKDLVLKAVGEWAQKQKGYPLLTIVLGRDPVTGEEVKPTLKGVIFAVLDLVAGGDKIKENLEKSKTIEKAAAWFKIEVGKLQLTWAGIKALFSQAWDAFRVADLLNPRLLFEKMWAIFGPSVMRLLAFLVAVGKKILEFIFEGAMLIAGPIGLQIVRIVRKIGDTFNLIVADPVAFVRHLVDAVKKGVRQFGANIWEHLKTGLIEWLTGTLGEAGLVLPKVWDLRGILDLALQILGVTWPKVRAKLVAVLGEKTVAMLESVFTFVKTLVTEGPAAAWKEIVAAIGNLWDMVIGGIKDWAVTKIVTAAVTKLATMFNPAGAVIQAVIATYNTIAFFIERIRQILAFVEAVVDSIANIAQGKIAAAANYVERAMARTIPVLLGFLARLIGLGDVSGAVKKVITAIQEKVDKAIDSVIKWVVDKAKSLFGGKAADAKKSTIPDGAASKGLAMAGESHTVKVSVKAGQITLTMASNVDLVLRDLARSAMKDVDGSGRPEEEKAFYRRILVDILNRTETSALQSAYEKDGSPPGSEAWLLKYITNIIESDLVPLAGHGIKSLTEFLAKIPPIRFLPSQYRSQWIRWNLYVTPGEWSSAQATVEARDRARIRADVDTANRTGNAALWDALQIAPDGKRGYKIPSWAVRGSFIGQDVLRTSMGVDHIVPIARHWTDVGHNAGDSVRIPIGRGPSNLELVTTEYNSRKQSLGATYKTSVDANFESDMAGSKKMSARIKDLPFLRAEAGGPVI